MRKKLIFLIFLITFLFSACKEKKVEELHIDDDVAESEPDISETEGLATDADEILKKDGAADTGETEYAVFVCGAVKNPGVYYLKKGSLKKAALDLAGGFTEDAASWYVNLAEEITSGERLYFPYQNEVEAYDFSQLEKEGNLKSEDEKELLVNINTANEQDLITLPGIGESRAKAIIQYRDSHGGFKDKIEICQVDGIKEGLYNKIKDYITVN